MTVGFEIWAILGDFLPFFRNGYLQALIQILTIPLDLMTPILYGIVYKRDTSAVRFHFQISFHFHFQLIFYCIATIMTAGTLLHSVLTSLSIASLLTKSSTSGSASLLEIVHCSTSVLLCTEDEVPDFVLVHCCTVLHLGSFVVCCILCI